MVSPVRETIRAIVLLGVAAFCAAAQPVTVVAVRHAERAEAPAEDPPLTEAGRARAKLLAGMLRDARISAVFASEFRRTVETAQPTASRFKLSVTVVPGADPKQLRKRILAQTGKTVLVVGHSNTIPALIRVLGGPGGITIEDTEFDRLFILHVTAQDKATLLTLRYGADATQVSSAIKPGVIRFRRTGGIAGREIGGAIVTGPDGTRVEGAGGYSREIPPEVVSGLLEFAAAAPKAAAPNPGADQYQYEVTIERTGQTFTLGESAPGELAQWLRKETAAIERAAGGSPK